MKKNNNDNTATNQSVSHDKFGDLLKVVLSLSLISFRVGKHLSSPVGGVLFNIGMLCAATSAFALLVWNIIGKVRKRRTCAA